jgi:uncharacterized peroxidase-related enzyme
VTESKDKESTTMPRLNAVDPARATGKAKDLLAAVKAQLGLTPNMMRTMATSPAVLEGYLSLGTALAGGSLPARLREQIALAVAEANGCDYCLSAHTTLGRLAGLKDDEIARSREAASTDPKTEAVLRFAVAVVAERGNVSDEEFAQVRGAGFSDGEIAEILAHVAINTFTNYFNKAAGTAIDFPRVEAARKSA